MMAGNTNKTKTKKILNLLTTVIRMINSNSNNIGSKSDDNISPDNNNTQKE